ncbi:PAS domain-containing protein [Ralstonia solanacearum]|uniref:histidine kinase n=2 Tax=Ralstonia solanacearum TaxID=305 RepID=A0AAE3NJ92_RALSL|nr:PAS domain-containing protein [Ralstonia solanacearum]KFX29765.1 ATPase [Ralstonia solanacearum]MBB6581472.1 PAS domain-containing protein [Ralstonia solanacearum]MDB0521466.1 PAS domain-containing protein [Ralstonia solanacearum]
MKPSSQRDGRHLHLTWRDVIDAVRKLTTTIRPNEQNFDAAADVRGAAFCILSPDGHFVSANGSAGAIFGYSGNELIGRSLLDMTANGGRQDILDGLSRCAAGTFHSFQAQLCVRGGRHAPMLLHQHPIFDSDGCVGALLTIFEEPSTSERVASDSAGGLLAAESDAKRQYAFLMIGQERERKRISSELHDGLGQALTLIKLTVEDALIHIHRNNIAEATELLDTAVLRIRESIGDVRRICCELRPALLDRLGLAASLDALCKRVEEGAGHLAVRFDCGLEDEEVPDNLKADIFRITQEAMNNAVRHGAATEIRLGLRRIEAGILLTIQDNGIGFDTQPLFADPVSQSGLGLIGMQQRVELNGGSFFIQSSVGDGTLVSALWRA